MSSTPTDPSLTEELTTRGLTHSPTGAGYDHHVQRNGTTVFTGGAGDVWEWLDAMDKRINRLLADWDRLAIATLAEVCVGDDELLRACEREMQRRYHQPHDTQ